MICSISNPDDKIATDIGSKSTTKNRIAIWVISATAIRVISVTGSDLTTDDRVFQSMTTWDRTTRHKHLCDWGFVLNYVIGYF